MAAISLTGLAFFVDARVTPQSGNIFVRTQVMFSRWRLQGFLLASFGCDIMFEHKRGICRKCSPMAYSRTYPSHRSCSSEMSYAFGVYSGSTFLTIGMRPLAMARVCTYFVWYCWPGVAVSFYLRIWLFFSTSPVTVEHYSNAPETRYSLKLVSLSETSSIPTHQVI
jgi:hypothetical protein